MTSVHSLLEAERELERAFVAYAKAREREPKGWRAALIMFHLAIWRERICAGLTDLRDGRPYTPAPTNIDETNDADIATAGDVTLAEEAERNSLTHPSVHMSAYWEENGEVQRAVQLLEDVAGRFRDAQAPPPVLGAALYNLASGRAKEGRADEALSLLEQAVMMRADLHAMAAEDPHFARWRGAARFDAIVSG